MTPLFPGLVNGPRQALPFAQSNNTRQTCRFFLLACIALVLASSVFQGGMLVFLAMDARENWRLIAHLSQVYKTERLNATFINAGYSTSLTNVSTSSQGTLMGAAQYNVVAMR